MIISHSVKPSSKQANYACNTIKVGDVVRLPKQCVDGFVRMFGNNHSSRKVAVVTHINAEENVDLCTVDIMFPDGHVGYIRRSDLTDSEIIPDSNAKVRIFRQFQKWQNMLFDAENSYAKTADLGDIVTLAELESESRILVVGKYDDSDEMVGMHVDSAFSNPCGLWFKSQSIQEVVGHSDDLLSAYNIWLSAWDKYVHPESNVDEGPKVEEEVADKFAPEDTVQVPWDDIPVDPISMPATVQSATVQSATSVTLVDDDSLPRTEVTEQT